MGNQHGTQIVLPGVQQELLDLVAGVTHLDPVQVEARTDVVLAQTQLAVDPFLHTVLALTNDIQRANFPDTLGDSQAVGRQGVIAGHLAAA